MNYRYMKAVDRQNYIAYRRRYFTDPESADSYIAKHKSAKENANSDLKPVFQLQDNYINAPLEVKHLRDESLLDATWTNYGPGLDEQTVGSAEAVNYYPSSVQSVPVKKPIADFNAAVVSEDNSSIQKDSRYDLPDITLVYDNGNLTEATGRDGITTAYLWGYKNTLPIAKATGAHYKTLTDAYKQTGNDVSLLYQQLPLSKALLNTYDYQPVVGMIWETNPSQKKQYYEYDALGRLKLVRDQNRFIVKQYSYQYYTPNINPDWQATGNKRCKPCDQNPQYASTTQEHEEKDMNENSLSAGSTRWVDDGVTGYCQVAQWNYTGVTMCETDGNNGNTGYTLIQQTDANPCSLTFNTFRLQNTYVQDLNTCPIPIYNVCSFAMKDNFSSSNSDVSNDGINVSISITWHIIRI